MIPKMDTIENTREALREVSDIVENLCMQRGIDALLIIAPSDLDNKASIVMNTTMPEINALRICFSAMAEDHIKQGMLKALYMIATGAPLGDVIDLPKRQAN